MSSESASSAVVQGLDGLIDELEPLYRDVHSHPELSMQETRTHPAPHYGSSSPP